ncbi:CPBP family intramembrane glutamic endopeptidase [Parasporobacterium paucivorans]|uniref:CAAX prenyl protease 2/Lysostaphin resistance protein A-like domain-containing protein n=1 Tax=Parasporobacterium paucivorans DSM 15970 TaxID=1122934 RepID=A0A1M6FPA5_9FIRM|nr:CPBP family intramembrane glutamic endopeptidase [Parasporobacterium paucivorans]SHI99578.1 hypothetical protein SAMN02745691_01162 [Parasporobacterium paucivorans DSM 15970]
MYYETDIRKFWKVISPPIYYFLVNVLATYVFSFIYISSRLSAFTDQGKILTADNYSEFSKAVQDAVLNQSLLITCVAAIATLLLYFVKYRKNIQIDVEMQKVNISFGYAALLGMMASVSLSRLLSLLPIDNLFGNYAEVQNTLFGGNIFMEILTLAIIVPVLEEILFRGLVYGRMSRYSGRRAAAVISSIIFGIYHMNLLQGIYAFILGMLLVFVYEKYQSIMAPVILHAFANGFSIFLFYTDISNKISSNLYSYIIFMLVEAAIALWMIKIIQTKFKKLV